MNSNKSIKVKSHSQFDCPRNTKAGGVGHPKISMPETLQCIEDLATIAEIVDFPSKTLAWYAFHASHEQRYKTYEIPKSNGKFRLISEPQENLKVIQRRLARLFSCLCENKLKNLEKTQKGFGKCAHGFLPKKNISTNAKLHVDKSWLLNLDFKISFPVSRKKNFPKGTEDLGH